MNVSIFRKAIKNRRHCSIINKHYPFNIYNALLCAGASIGGLTAGYYLIDTDDNKITIRVGIIPLYISRGILVAAISPILVLIYVSKMIYHGNSFDHDIELSNLILKVKNSRIFNRHKE